MFCQQILDSELIEVTDQREIVCNKQIVSSSVLKGLTLDTNRKPIDNTLVFGTYVEECGYVGVQTLSNASGEFEFSRLHKEMTVVAINQEKNLFGIKKVGPEQSSVSVEMQSGGQIGGTLLNEDGKPEVGAEVQCYPHVAVAYGDCLRTKTDEQGRFEFRGLPIAHGGRIAFSPKTTPYHHGPDFDLIKDQTMVDLGEFQLSYDDERYVTTGA